MQKFDLTIFRQSRVLIGIFLTPFVFIGLILLGIELGNIFIGLLLFCVYLFTLYYFVVGHLTITVDNEQLKFSWTKKLFFNFKNIEPLNITDIRTIVIDNGLLLRKIITNNRTIKINTTKIQQKDTSKLICQLGILTEQNNVRKIDSWDEWADKGYIKTAYRINSIILVLVTIITISVIVKKGFDFRLLPLVLYFYLNYFYTDNK